MRSSSPWRIKSGLDRARGRVVSLFERFVNDDMRGIHYAVSMFIATTILWILVEEYGDANPIWAISSMVATIELIAHIGFASPYSLTMIQSTVVAMNRLTA